MFMEKDVKVENFVDAQRIRQLTARMIQTTGVDPGLGPGNIDQSYPKNWTTFGTTYPSMRALEQPPQLQTIEASLTLTKEKNEEVINAQNERIEKGEKENLPYNW